MNDLAIDIQDLRRAHGTRPVLQGLDLQIPRGSIYGLLGRNGSGKTTLLKLLAGLTQPDSGDIRVLGGNPWSFGAADRQQLGYVSEQQALPPQIRVGRLLHFCAHLYPAWDARLCDRLLGTFEMDRQQRVSKLSMGNQRLLAFILALAPRPAVLLLDEPAANLDVVARRAMLQELLSLVQDGQHTVLFSTHILTDVERVADAIGILVQGKLRVSCSQDELKERIQQVRLYDFTGAIPDHLPGALSYQRDRNEATAILTIDSDQDLHNLAARYQCRAELHPLSLEDLFLCLNQA